MRDYLRINMETGALIECLRLENPPIMPDGSFDPSYIDIPYTGGFFWPKWNKDTQAWEEYSEPPACDNVDVVNILQAQVKALSERGEFLEDVIAEMAMMLL